ncbi:uncharacterized protein J4E88_001644 [Alternaria novae-zelandiae]|uniref:uncharacterized protein n=1 Tax=Alternaria novae-zelandiae TaxID=430562 RepID=UPI0020C3B84D|nr:uncharacterized protein J4E88_001644 [Alternaria novae-zelandiae]KAI4693273.1 hypothetical protein J4E88_001644 [Alternaria novae-zelandiae]
MVAAIATLRVGVKTAMSFDPSKLITVVVGEAPDQRHFSVHEGLICARSEFFRRAMNGKWIESKNRMVRLPEDDPKVFDIYINLLYTGRLATNTLEEPKTNAHLLEEMYVLAQLYVIGEKLLDKATKNSAIQSLLEVSLEQDANGKSYPPTINTIISVYQGTCAGSLGRRLLVDLWIDIQGEFLATNAELLPKDFLVDLAVALLDIQQGKKEMLASMENMSNYLEKMD